MYNSGFGQLWTLWCISYLFQLNIPSISFYRLRKEEEDRERERKRIEKIQKRKERQEERENKRKVKRIEKKKKDEERRMQMKIAVEERKLLLAQRKLESIRLLSHIFDRVKVIQSNIWFGIRHGFERISATCPSANLNCSREWWSARVVPEDYIISSSEN